MGLEQQLEVDLKAAILQKDNLRRDVLRLARNAVSYGKMTKGSPLDEKEILVALNKEVRQRRESIDAYTQGDRHDLADKEKKELAILMEYLPKQKSREEITALVSSVIAELRAEGPTEKGHVMKKIMPILKGEADGALVNQVVSELLEN